MANTAGAAPIARLLIIGFLVATLLPSAASAATKPAVTPIVLFPAYHLTRLRVDVHNQTVAPKCDPSGTFEYWFQNPHPSTQFDQKRQDQFLTPRYASDSDRPLALRFSNHRCVSVTIPHY